MLCLTGGCAAVDVEIVGVVVEVGELLLFVVELVAFVDDDEEPPHPDTAMATAVRNTTAFRKRRPPKNKYFSTRRH